MPCVGVRRAIIQAVQAGVPVVSLSIPYSVADRRFTEALNTAREYNIKVSGADWWRGTGGRGRWGRSAL